METKHGTPGDCSRGNEFPVAYLRLMAPPLQLFSAAMWQVVQQGLVDHYGMLEEFVTMVTELVPQLMSYSQRAQLILGLRARLVLELCRGTDPVDLQIIQPHLDRIKAPSSTAKDHHVTIDQVEESEVNFVELVHTLLESPEEKERFFQEVYPEHFGPKYDTALEILVWEFISRLDELLPIPDFTQMVEWLVGVPSFLHDTLQSFTQREDMKVALELHGNLEQFEEKDPSLLPMDDCILYSLSLPPNARPSGASASRSPSPDVILLQDTPERKTGPAEGRDRRNLERARQRRERRGLVAAEMAGGGSPDRADVASPRGSPSPADVPPPAEPSTDEDVYIARGGRALRKRKLSRTSDPPPKQPSKGTSSLRASTLEAESSGESPLISILGDYTDPQAPALPAAEESKAPWSDEETLHLLEIWGKDSVQRGLQGCLKNRHIFSLIAQRLAGGGSATRSVEQCQTRIKRLKKAYRRCLKKNKRKTNKTECKFYEQLDRVLGGASGGPKVTYDPDELMEEEEEGGEEEEEEQEDQEQGDENELQFLGFTSGEVMAGARSVPWSDAETLSLVNIWAKDQGARGGQRKGPVFPSIAQKMADLGYARSAQQCQSRLKRLKSMFRQCYHNNIKGKRHVECKFYDALGRVLTKDPSFSDGLDDSSDLTEQEEPLPLEEEPTDEDLSATWYREMGAVERRKVPWSDKETVILLELWADHQVQQSVRRGPHNGHMFTDISERLAADGFFRSANQCHTRVKRLKARYRRCRDNLRLTGTDNIDFKFYDLLEQIVEKQPSTSSSSALPAGTPIEISEDSDGGETASNADAPSPSPSPKAQAGSWSDEETLALIAVWGVEEVQRALRSAVHNGRVYAEIAQRMRARGHAKSQEQCRWKVKALRAGFRQGHQRKRRSSQVDYKFYSQLEEILGQEVASINDEEEEEEEEKEEEEEGQEAAGPNGAASSGPWSEPETVALIGLWAADDVQESLRACVHNSHIYGDIAANMAALGYPRTPEQCTAKIKNLKKTYRSFCNSRRSGAHPMLFAYYQLMEPVLGDASPPAGDPAGWDANTLPLLDPEEDLADLAFPAGRLQAESSRKMPWSERETETLLGVWGEDGVQLTLTAGGRTRHLYDYISQKMRGLGFTRSPEQCYTRLKRLRAAFHHDKKDFKYFDQMERIYNRVMSVDGGDEGEEGEEEDPVLTGDAAEIIPDMPDLDQDLAALLPASSAAADGAKQAWGEQETQLLLELWGSEGVQEALRNSNKTRPVLTRVSQTLAEQGFQRTPRQCQTRIKRLKRTFRRFVEDSRGGTEKQECKYFDQLLRVFGAQYIDADALANATLDMPVSPESSNGRSP